MNDVVKCCKVMTLLLMSTLGAVAAISPVVLHDFGLGLELGGSTLYAGLILDASGNLYGSAEFGGASNDGVVFRLSRNAGGTWTEAVLHSFKGGTTDGATPHASVLMDHSGNLYGTTIAGGGGQCSGGCGMVFKLVPTASGPWTETVLHEFTGGTDGATPFSDVIMDAQGNVYGTTTAGGSHGFGAVYKLTAAEAGPWTETVLYSFGGAPDGSAAFGAPVFDAAGNLYGTTNGGGSAGLGTVWELTPSAQGLWSERVLHNFHGKADGSDLFAGLTFDGAGNLYGAAETGGSANSGTVFKLANAAGHWNFTILHNFLGLSAGDGENPNAVIFDPLGNIYGTTAGGGTDNPGTIFKMTPQSAGWKETVLYSFTAGSTGAYPSAGLVMDPAGNLYGTTLWGGPSGDTTGGVAFEFTP